MSFAVETLLLLHSTLFLFFCLQSQLFKLMNKLEETTPHFIRCIKPNSNQLPGIYEENHVLQQLRCCGVLEIVRISRSGYHTRMTHQDLAARFGLSTFTVPLFVDSSLVTNNSHAFLSFFFLSLLACAWIRYGFLLDTKLSQDPLSTSDSIMKQFNLPPEMYQVGYRKIYLRTGQVSYFYLKIYYELVSLSIYNSNTFIFVF